MTTKDFTQLFPEILNPAVSLSNLKALCRSKKYPEDEFISCLHDFSLLKNNYPGYIENPGGYLNTSIDNCIKKYFRGEKNDFSDIENLSDTVEMDDHDKKSLKERLDDFTRGINKLNLPTNQRRLIEEMVVICENDHKTHRGFIKEVREAQARHGVTNANFRKLLERLKNNLKGNDGLKDTLSYIPTDDQSTNKLIELLLSYIPMTTNKLDEYRFSSDEMKKMLWLKDLFEDNGFTVERFPEVYYDTFDKACEVWPILKENKYEEGTPDYLGVYITNYPEIKCEENCDLKIVNEGVIVLFKDRILEYAERIDGKLALGLSVIENSLKEVVLYHELGHWFSHWPLDDSGFNWKCGYNSKDKITHESFAQIIAYWCSVGNPVNEIILRDYLTPINVASPYNKYLDLMPHSKNDILNKLKLIRKHMGCSGVLTDETAYAVLKSNIIDEIIDHASKSPRNLELNIAVLKSIKPEILNHFIAYRFGKNIEYDYILCILNSKEPLDENSIKVLKFDDKFCIS
jgi:hypothetical protein